MLEKYALVVAIKAVLSVPNRSFSVRGLAKEAGLSPGAARVCFDYMHSKGIVLLKTIGRTYQYRANVQSPLCRHWKILFNLDKIHDSGLVEEVAKKIPQVHAVLLYGSFAKGTNDEKSDVDLLVITNKPARTDLGFVNRLGKEVNLSVLSFNEWKKKSIADKVFYENIIYDSIVLFGERPVVA